MVLVFDTTICIPDNYSGFQKCYINKDQTSQKTGFASNRNGGQARHFCLSLRVKQERIDVPLSRPISFSKTHWTVFEAVCTITIDY